MLWGLRSAKQAEVKKKWSDIKMDVKRRLAAHRQRRRGYLDRESAQLWVTLLSQGWWVWLTLITPKVNTCICVTHNKRVHTVTSEEVRRRKGEAD